MLKLEAFFCSPDLDPFDEVDWKLHSVESGKTVEFPSFWSSMAIEITTSKYFRRAGFMETSLKHLLSRVTQTLRSESMRQNYFDENSATIFEKELRSLLLHQMAAFNSPVWFNCGLFPSYGIKGMQTELYAWESEKKRTELQTFSYVRPQISACYIQSVDPQNLEELARNEEKIFRFGSGTGSNFSSLQDAQLFDFLEILDKNAGKIKSGGVARRAAKMVCLDIDHPNILEFIHWKMLEERKLRQLVEQGHSGEFESKAFDSLGGQNSNNSIRISDAFFQALSAGARWKTQEKEVSSEQLWNDLCLAAWECGDPGVQFSDTINRSNTCAETDMIHASNPCSEYMFLDETACNLSSLNLAKFYEPCSGFNFDRYRQAARIMFIAQDILVDHAGYPTEEIAIRSHRFRPLGLGYSNFGGLLMRMGVAYESEEAVEWARVLTALLHLTALQTSAEIAARLGAFEEFSTNQSSCMRVMQLHAQAWSDMKLNFVHLDVSQINREWQELLAAIRLHGLRNSQATVIAPAGTISFFMDCETTGIEPEYSLLRYKSLSGGGLLKIVNQALVYRLRHWGYAEPQVQRILKEVELTGHLEGAKNLAPAHRAVFKVTSPPKGAEGRVSWQAQLEVVAAAQHFLSGAISKTVNIPEFSTLDDVSNIYKVAHQKGIKSIALYREGSKSSQPLRNKP